MSALMQRHEAAFGNITFLLDKYIQPNTMYYEGNHFPCGETPPAAAGALQDLLLQSWDENIHVFPSVDDDKLRQVSFYEFRTEGAFLVSARRENGTTMFVQITSLAGEPCVLKTDMMPPLYADPPSITFHSISGTQFFVSSCHCEKNFKPF
jgi:alpha-L-fucosidase 2